MFAGEQNIPAMKHKMAAMNGGPQTWLPHNGAHQVVTAETQTKQRILAMLYTIAVILLILWLLGLVTSTTIGGFIHVLLVFAIVVILLRVISGRRAV